MRRGRAVAGDLPGDAVQHAAANCRLPGGEVSVSVSTAIRRGRSGRGSPMAARSGDRMNTSKDTSALTGLPGSVTIGVPAACPDPCGMPGCMATLTKSTELSEARPNASLTTS